ncbi:MAG: transcriptional regulator [Gammaproteobacteria bacterium]|nr:MAG: transcriptional regulator [Gammaproteobacteria bacterium]
MERRDLERMLLFQAVVEHGGFSAAAAALGVSKSHLSQSVRALEASLRAKLCHRNSRRLVLTEKGRRLLEQCRALNRLMYETRARLQADAGARGVLRITAAQAFGERYLLPVCQAFMRRHPHIHIELDLDNAPRDLFERGYDLAVRITERPPESFVARPLLRFDYVCCAAPAYLERAGRPQHPRALVDHECLVNTTWREWRFYRGAETIRVTPRGRLAFNNNTLLREAALAGLGIVRLASYLVRDDLAAGRLERVLPGFSGEQRPIYLIYPPRTDQPAKLRLFVDHLLAHFGGEGTA